MGCRREGPCRCHCTQETFILIFPIAFVLGEPANPRPCWEQPGSPVGFLVFFYFLFVFYFFYGGGWFVCLLIYICSGSRSGDIYGICGWLMGVILQAEFLRFLLEASFFSNFLCFPLPFLFSLLFFLLFFFFSFFLLREPGRLNAEFFPL